MRVFHGAVLCVLALASSALAVGRADEDIVLPKPLAVPQPMPAPAAFPPLTADTYYVVTSKTALVVRQHPAGLLKVTHEVGPVTLRGRFIDSAGKTLTRKYAAAAHVYVLEAVEGAKGRAEVDFIPLGLEAEGDIKAATIDVDAGQGPQPPPPAPDPKPKPDPDAPIPAAGLRVLVVYDAAKLSTLTAEQQGAIYSKDVRDYLRANCPKGTDGVTAEWRMWPADVDAGGESKLWQDALKRPRKGDFWVIVSNGTTGYEGPLPASTADMLALLKKYGGK